MISRTRWHGGFTVRRLVTLVVYHALKAAEVVVFLGGMGRLPVNNWAAFWLFSRED